MNGPLCVAQCEPPRVIISLCTHTRSVPARSRTKRHICGPVTPTGKWVELMQEFHMEILYCKGQDNVVADGLSRIMNTMSFTVLEKSLLQEIQEA